MPNHGTVQIESRNFSYEIQKENEYKSEIQVCELFPRDGEPDLNEEKPFLKVAIFARLAPYQIRETVKNAIAMKLEKKKAKDPEE